MILLNIALPEELRDYNATWDKARVKSIFSWLADNRPHQYRQVLHDLSKAGIESATYGRSSFTMDDLTPPEEGRLARDQIRTNVQKMRDHGAPKEKIAEYLSAQIPKLKDVVFAATKKSGNAFAKQIVSGARGNAQQLSSLLGSDLMYQDHKDRPISEIPILNSYVEGLDPWEYWASTYGARRGSLKAKFATRDAGAWGKHLGQSVHDLTVTDENCNTKHGLTVPTEDEDSIGSVLAVDTGPFKSGQMITGRVLSTLNKKKIDKIAVRSVVTCQSSHGVCATCAGLREHGRFPKVGENVGLPASQSFGESLSQTQLSAKHTGGVAGVGSSVSGFKAFDQMIQFPKKFLGGAVLAKHDGRIQTIEQAPSGGWYVTINGEQHYVPADRTLSVKSGQAVEQGDTISDGIASPAEVAAYKGLGHARRQFIKSFYDLAKDSGMPTQRRNVEALARGLLRYVAIDEPIGDNLPGDVVDYNQLRKNWTPPEDSVQMPIQKAIGQYAMAPIGELEIGDRIDSRTAKEMSSQYKDPIWVRKDPPPFKPYVVRALEHVSYSDNWLARMGGSYLKRSVLDAVGRGQKAPIHSTSYIGSYAYGDEFGKNIDKTGQY